MKKNKLSKRWWYIIAALLFILLIGLDIIRFRSEKRREAFTKERITAVQETEERVTTENDTELKEGEDDDYRYQKEDLTTQEKLVPEYEDYYEEFDTGKQ